jgi:hypothetical protein
MVGRKVEKADYLLDKETQFIAPHINIYRSITKLYNGASPDIFMR